MGQRLIRQLPRSRRQWRYRYPVEAPHDDVSALRTRHDTPDGALAILACGYEQALDCETRASESSVVLLCFSFSGCAVPERGGWEACFFVVCSGGSLVLGAEFGGAFVEAAEPVVEAVEEGGVGFEDAEFEDDEEDEDDDDEGDQEEGAGGGG